MDFESVDLERFVESSNGRRVYNDVWASVFFVLYTVAVIILAIISGIMTQLPHDYLKVFVAMGISAAVSSFICVVFLQILKYFPKKFIQVSIYGTCLTFFALFFLLMPIDTLFSMVFLINFVIFFLYQIPIDKKNKDAITALQDTSEMLFRYPLAVIPPIIQILINFMASIVCFLCATFYAIYCFPFLCFWLIWFPSVISNTVFAIISQITYLHLQYREKRPNAAWNATKIAQKSFGSICYESLFFLPKIILNRCARLQKNGMYLFSLESNKIIIYIEKLCKKYSFGLFYVVQGQSYTEATKSMQKQRNFWKIFCGWSIVEDALLFAQSLSIILSTIISILIVVFVYKTINLVQFLCVLFVSINFFASLSNLFISAATTSLIYRNS